MDMETVERVTDNLLERMEAVEAKADVHLLPAERMVEISQEVVIKLNNTGLVAMRDMVQFFMDQKVRVEEENRRNGVRNLNGLSDDRSNALNKLAAALRRL